MRKTLRIFCPRGYYIQKTNTQAKYTPKDLFTVLVSERHSPSDKSTMEKEHKHQALD
jgi:hypothetical protein